MAHDGREDDDLIVLEAQKIPDEGNCFFKPSCRDRIGQVEYYRIQYW